MEISKNTLMVFIAIIIGSVVLGGFYFFTESKKQETILQLEREKFLNEKRLEDERRDEEEAKKAEAEAQYNDCMQRAYDLYVDNWNSSCKDLGEADDCKLISTTADRWDEALKDDEENCFNLYGR